MRSEIGARLRPAFVRLPLTWGIGGLLGWVGSHAGLPLPWLIGALITSAGLAMTFDLPPPPRITRLAGQVTVGSAIGLYITHDAALRVIDFAPAILVTSGMTMLFSMVLVLANRRLLGLDPVTALMSSLPGQPAEMAFLAEQHGGDAAQVALTQTIRVVAVVVCLPQILLLMGTDFASGRAAAAAASAEVQPLRLAMLLGIGSASAAVALRIGLVNAPFLGPMLGVGGVTAMGPALGPVPTVLISVAQIVLGTALGANFRPGKVAVRAGLLTWMIGSALLLISACSALAWGMATWLGADFRTMLIANAPGGHTEMSLTAKAMQADVSMVVAFHMLRMVIVMGLLGLFVSWWKPGGRAK